MIEERKLNRKKPNYLKSILLAGVVIFYIYWGLEALSSGINTKESYIDTFAVGILIILLFSFSLYWGIIIWKKAYEKYPNTTLKVTLILIIILILYAIFFGDGTGGGYWNTFQYDTHY